MPDPSNLCAPPKVREHRRRKLSEILWAIASDPARERVTVGDLLAAMGDRAFGALMVIFALPNILPTPPGTSSVLGLPLVFLAAQLMVGRRPWLPEPIGRRSMTREDFVTLIARASHWLTRAERFLRPRLSGITYPPGEYAIGGICLVLAIILVLPIPLGNMLPAASICLFSFGILERDGLWVIAGVAAAIASVALVAGVVFALVKAAIFIIANAFH